MGSLLIHDALVLATFDGEAREIAGGGLYAEDGVIVALGARAELPAGADTVIDARGHVVMPGLVNAHHHLYQTLTRGLPAAQDQDLFGWLSALYPVWARMDAAAFRVGVEVAIAELLISGCTTTVDHVPAFPNDVRLDDTIAVARAMGIRIEAARGAVTIGRSAGGVTPDGVVETEDAIIADLDRLIDRHHDPARHAMTRIAVAPTSPFQVTPDFMRAQVRYARRRGVRIHTHLAENADDVAFSLKRFGMTPTAYVESVGLVGDDVWHAHCVHLDAAGIALFARTGTGVAHCPCSNMRLGSGVPPIPLMLAAGAPVGLGVDGSSSNDSGHMLAEARQAMLLARVAGGSAAMSARTALSLATRGAARVLGRDDIGRLAVGAAADVAVFPADGIAAAGFGADPLAALVFGTPPNARHTIVAGRPRVADGRLVGVDVPDLLARHAAAVERLTAG